MFDTAKTTRGSCLVVLIPETLVGDLELSRSVAQFARGRVREVVYLAVLERIPASLQVTRSMVTMKAMTSDRSLNVSYQVLGGPNTAKILRSLFSAQDTIIVPQPCTDHSGKFKFIPVRSNDWYSVKLALSFAANKYGSGVLEHPC